MAELKQVGQNLILTLDTGEVKTKVFPNKTEREDIKTKFNKTGVKELLGIFFPDKASLVNVESVKKPEVVQEKKVSKGYQGSEK